MSRFPRLVCLAPFLASLVLAAAPAIQATAALTSSAAPAGRPAQPASIPVMPGPIADAAGVPKDTHPVTVNVVVQDSNGRPVRGLKSGDFSVTEDKVPQTIRSFEEHYPVPPSAKAVEAPELPPGTFTDETPIPSNGALNVLLLDGLNTPTKDPRFLRYELQQYVNNVHPGTRIAVIGLSSQLFLLQDFTSDPERLKHVVDHKLIPRVSSVLDDPASMGRTGGSSSGNAILASRPNLAVNQGNMGLSMAQVAANLTQFEFPIQLQMKSLTQAARTQVDLQYTLDALNDLGHYLSAFPGRKNVIWVSDSFPLEIPPDATLQKPFEVPQVSPEEFRETTDLLTRAQVAFYPVDARNLMAQSKSKSADSGPGYASKAAKFNSRLGKFSTSQAQEHRTMEQIATATGGHAFYDIKSVAGAVADAIGAGSDYYTLTYQPTDRKRDGSYRNIRVVLKSNNASGFQLSYLHGYFAGSPTSAVQETNSTPAHATAGPYAIAAMRRGAPAPAEIMLEARVLPASTSTEASVAEGNVLNPHDPLKGPFRRYDADCLSLSKDLSLTPGPGDRRTGRVELLAYVYDPNGKLLIETGRSIQINLTPATYKKFLQSVLRMHLEVSAPASRESYLRIGLHDLNSNRFGVVEVPILDVSHLAPPTYPPATGPPRVGAGPSGPISQPSTVPHPALPQ